MEIALYRCHFTTGKGEKLCFVKRKDKVFLSDNRVTLEEKVCIFRVLLFWIKKVVDFLSKSPFFDFLLPCFYFIPPTFHFLHPCFHFIPPNFLDKPPSFLALLPHFHIVPSSLPYYECNVFVALAYFVCFSAARIGASTRTRAPTSRTHRVLNSCLHPSPSPLTI